MKTTRLAFVGFILLLIFVSGSTFSQGSGKVTLKGEFESPIIGKNFEINILNLVTRESVYKQDVSKQFFCELALQEKYMIHIKQEGMPAVRLNIETNASDLFNYFVQFAINFNNLNDESKSGISVAAGTIFFDESLGSFEHRSGSINTGHLFAVKHSATTPEVAKF